MSVDPEGFCSGVLRVPPSSWWLASVSTVPGMLEASLKLRAVWQASKAPYHCSQGCFPNSSCTQPVPSPATGLNRTWFSSPGGRPSQLLPNPSSGLDPGDPTSP